MIHVWTDTYTDTMAPQTEPLSIDEGPTIQPSTSQAKVDSLTDHILNNLTHAETEQAARASSYKYLISSADPSKSTTNYNRNEYAKLMIRKYLIVEQKLHPRHSPEDWAINAESKLKKT